ncbi:MAG: primosomal protein N' family DNA-binding protein, partial [Planctomycetota bacterium]
MQLFETEKSQEVSRPQAGCVVAVAVNANLWRTFDYLFPAELGAPQKFQRVRVPFGRGNRPTLGFIVETGRVRDTRKLKTVTELIDRSVQLDERLQRLGEWIHEYYLTPLGMTLAAMVPAAVGRGEPRKQTVAFLTAKRSEFPSALGAKQRRILDELYEAKKQGVEPLTLEHLLHHADATRDSVKRLVTRKLIRLESQPVRLEQLSDEQSADPFELNADQQRVLADLGGKVGDGFSCTLLYGVTGSGKTEIYIRLIREVIAAGTQAIVLAPELAL